VLSVADWSLMKRWRGKRASSKLSELVGVSGRDLAAGTINLPYAGRIKAAGLTEDQLERSIERRLVDLQILAEP